VVAKKTLNIIIKRGEVKMLPNFILKRNHHHHTYIHRCDSGKYFVVECAYVSGNDLLPLIQRRSQKFLSSVRDIFSSTTKARRGRQQSRVPVTSELCHRIFENLTGHSLLGCGPRTDGHSVLSPQFSFRPVGHKSRW